MAELMAVNDVVGNEGLFVHMAFIFADNAFEKKQKIWGLKNTHRGLDN
jgi:hypothetical protein